MNQNKDWIQTYTGRMFYILDPQTSNICIEDIAHSLSMKCRFNGHCDKFYSVSEHSILVSKYVPSEYAMWGLLHDAAEAYLPDVPRPIKPHLTEFKNIENNIMLAVIEKFSLNPIKQPSIVKRIDSAILANEAKQLMKPPLVPWNLPEKPLNNIIIDCLKPSEAFQQFMDRFNQLS